MLNNTEKKILRSIKFFPIFIIIVSSIILTYTFISQNKKIFDSESEQMKKDFIQKHKELSKKDVELIYNLVEYEKQNALKHLKINIKNKIQEAYHIASNIYKNNIHLSNDEIIEKIKDALRYARFNSGRGYYFIYTLDGTNILHPISTQLEGKNLWDYSNGTYVIRELSNIAAKENEGFYSWLWTKPDDKNNEYEKIGYVKKFEELNFFIGTGEYIIDFENEIKQNVLKRINQIKYDTKNYVFIIDYQGNYINHISNNLRNKNQIDLQDKNGFYITKEIIEAAKKGDDYVEYIGIPETRIGRTSKKISYIKGFDDWSWAIGSGFYPEDIKHLLEKKKKELEHTTEATLTKISFISVFITIATIIILYIFSNIIKKIFIRYRQRHTEIQQRLKDLLSDKTKKLSDSKETINSYIAMTKTDLNGIITYASDRFCKSLGYKKSELIGKSHSIVRHPKNSDALYKRMWNTIKKGEIFRDTIRNLTKDGDDFWCNILIYPDFDKDKNIIGYTALRIDVTDKKRIEKINRNLEIEIEKAVENNRAKDLIMAQQSKMASMGEMLQNIAHQWRQPLSVISAAASGMKLQKDFDQLSDEHFYNSVQNIIRNSKHLSQTIDTFRDFFKTDKHKVLFNLQKTFEKTRKLIDSKYRSSDISIIDSIEGVELVGLESDLIQVLMNILNNAKDAFDNVDQQQDKYIFIDVNKDEHNAIIKIKDNAGGISPDIINKIFDPYFTTKHKAQGTGIGLFMSTEIISKHMNGSFNVQNQTYDYKDTTYTGAEFKITLPLKEQKSFDNEILNKIIEFNCYKWEKDVERFVKINLNNDKLVLQNISEISNVLYKYNIKFEVLENQDIQVYFDK